MYRRQEGELGGYFDKSTMMGVYVTLCLRFGFDIIWGQRCCLVSTFADCHNWREDIVVPYVTTYAIPLRRNCKIVHYDILITNPTKKNRLYRFFHNQRNLRGIFDEKRLDEIF